MITVMLIDDHPIVRAGVRAVLDTATHVTVVGESASGEEGVAAAALLSPNVVLCDLRLGAGIDGIETTRRLRALPAPPAVLILTTYDRDVDILRAIEAGAAGYLLKDAPTVEILGALAAAAAGQTVLAPELARRAGALRHDPELTKRELEVLKLVARGDSNRDIARALFVSETTIKTHVAHILTKLGVVNRSHAAAVARERGLIE